MRFICIAFLVFFQFTNAQRNEGSTVQALDTLPLSEALRKIETLHDVKFAYNPNLVSDKRISLDLAKLSLQESISAIESTFRIIFDGIDDRYFTLKKQTENISICGYVMSREGGKPIHGANIINKNTKLGVISNEEGYFALEKNNDGDVISLSFLGYETIELTLDQISVKKCGAVVLSPTSFLLEEVVVQEYLGAGIVKMKDGAIKIDPNNLDILSGLSEPDILQNIQLLPGIESPGETASGLYIRGGSPDQNLILWDDIKMYNSNHFFGMISAFNPYTIKDVNISRSGTDPKYGDRISGVIDIRTEDIVPEKLEGQVGINTLFADLNLNVPLSKNVGLFVSGRRSLVELYKSATFNAFSRKVFQNTSVDGGRQDIDPDFIDQEERFNFHDFSIKSVFKLSPKDKLTISALTTRNFLDFSLRDTGLNQVSNDLLNITNWGSSTSWSRFWNDKLKSKITAYYSNHELKYNGQRPYLNESFTSRKENTIREFGFASHFDWSLGNTISMTGGYDFFSNMVAYTLAFDDSNVNDSSTGRTHSVYGQFKFEKEDNWNIGLGIRANHYGSLNSFFLEPRIYVGHNLTKNLSVKASAELRNQAVSQILEFFTADFGLENQIWDLAKQDGIPLLKSDQLSLGLLYSLSNGWHIDVDAYYKNIDGFTTFTRGFESLEDDPSEGNSLIKGIDILVKKKIGNYSSWLGYTYASADFLFNELNQGRRFRGNNDIRHSLTWSHFYKWKNFQFSVGWKYRTGIPYTQALSVTSEFEGFIINYDAPNSKTLPDYHRMDFSILYDFKLGKKNGGTAAKLGFSLLNAYSRRNILNRNFDIFVESDENGNITNTGLSQIDKYSLGITPSFFCRIKF